MQARRAGAGRAGLAFTLLYVATALGYGVLFSDLRPLFDGFAPPPPYRWVNPPPEFRAGNEPPRPSAFDLMLGPAGSEPASGSSEDGQVVLSFPAGAFAPSPGSERVAVTITPAAPATLGPVPAGLRASGNAYRLDFVNEPSKERATALAVRADAFVVVPDAPEALLFSADGVSWERLPPRPVGDPSQVGGAFGAPGYLLGGAAPSARPASSLPSDEAGRIARAAAATVALAAAFALAPAALRWARGRP